MEHEFSESVLLGLSIYGHTRVVTWSIARPEHHVTSHHHRIPNVHDICRFLVPSVDWPQPGGVWDYIGRGQMIRGYVMSVTAAPMKRTTPAPSRNQAFAVFFTRPDMAAKKSTVANNTASRV